MNKKYLEVCCYSIDSCLIAQKGGADRVELCANITEGGTTPDYATIVYAKDLLKIDTMVMIRPRGGDFLYSETEFALMQKNIQLCKTIGVKGVVLGLLTAEGNVDKERTKLLVEMASPMEVCFHRAVDMARDYFHAIEDIIDCNCKRILTSGQRNKAIEGLQNISQAQNLYGKQIEIMAGSGVNEENVKEIYDLSGISNFHFSAKKTINGNMKFRQPAVSMGSEFIDEYSLVVMDINKVKQVREILDFKL
ncbi:MAG: copper homeostasis protein CutC [Bacteroidota bacterium]|nr:copper homeostasis protein CutC [Bacteroidota bacterium]